MRAARPEPATPPPARPPAVGCVSYLNAKPLIDGFSAALPGHDLVLDVPSGQIELLRTGLVDLALCPVIDYYRSPEPLVAVPVGGIGCHGPTLTVRLYSPVPFHAIRRVSLDADSHTSVCLMAVVLDALFAVRPEVTVGLPNNPVDTDAPPGVARLLIGDKVVTRAPSADDYPHQLDLGAAWYEMTGRPFVFATWLARADTALGDLPAALAGLREANLARTRAIATTHAADHGWPAELAADYLDRVLRYTVGPEELEAVACFAQHAATLGLIADPPRPLRTHLPARDGPRA